MYHVDNNSFRALGNTTELNNLFCLFSSERYLRRNFFVKVAGCSLRNYNFTKDELLLQVFFSYQKVLTNLF